MTKPPLAPILVLALSNLPACAQVPATTIASTPIASHGVPLALVQDPARGVTVVSRVRGSVRKRYVQIFLGIHNTGTAVLNFNPAGMTFIAGDSGYFLPMNAADVRDMAKEAVHRQILGAIGLAPQPAFGDSPGDPAESAEGANLQAYRQTTDDLYDASVEDGAGNPSNFPRTNLTRATVYPGDKLEGFVYFDLGKNGADSGSYKGYKLKIPLNDQVYEMDFTAIAKAVVLAAPSPAAPSPAPASPTPPSPAPVRTSAAAPAAPKPQAVGLPPAPIGNSALQVVSEPDEADVTLDGKFVGQTPLLIPLPSGDHTLRLTKNGFVAWEQKIHATGVRVAIDAELKAQMVIRVK